MAMRTDSFEEEVTPSRGKELPVVRKTYDLILWAIPILNRFPKTHARGLGDRMVGQMYSVLERLLRARYAQDKLARLDDVDAELLVLRYQIRLCLDLKLVSERRYEFAAKQMVEIGTDLSQWRQYLRRRAAEQAKP